MYYVFKMKKARKNKIKRITWFFISVIVIYVLWCIYKPLPLIRPQISNLPVKQNASSELDWPKTGQSAIGFVDSDYEATNGVQKPAPIASVAKVITALVVLEKYPLKSGEQGPTITLNDKDEALYRNYKANDGSIVPSANGEKITEYQMLQAMMLPSANNMSDSLAIWAYGSLENYSKEASTYLKRNGMRNTVVGEDASGLHPTTVSTAEDLVKLGKLAMKNTVLANIVSQQTATGIPLTTTVKNVNILLGNSNIVGIKTGNSDHAGGAFLSASTISPNNKPVTTITAVLQANNLYSALASSLSLIKSSQKSFSNTQVAAKGQVIGTYKAPWGDQATAVSEEDVKTTSYNKIKPKVAIQLDPIRQQTKTGDNIGSITLEKNHQNNQSSYSVIFKGSINKPSTKWRLTHPMSL